MSADPAAYWEGRAVRFGEVDRGLPAICSYGMPRLYNEAIDVIQRIALIPVLAQWRGLDVLDAGCGIGRWSIELARLGNRVVGIDHSDTMVALARRNAQAAGVGCEFEVGSVVAHRLERKFDAALTVTVLQHLVDDAKHGAAIRNLASHLKPGGVLVMLEVAPSQPTTACDSATFRARPLSSYRASLAEAGLEVLSVTGVDAQMLRTLSMAAMRTLPTRLARVLVSAAAPLAVPADVVVGRLFPNACWHKVIVARPAG
jgi:SAM-dependent methyltransferase